MKKTKGEEEGEGEEKEERGRFSSSSFFRPPFERGGLCLPRLFALPGRRIVPLRGGGRGEGEGEVAISRC